MENSIIFVIVILFYFCVIFPFQMRYYLLKRQRRLARLQVREPSAVNDSSYTRTVTYINSANNQNRPVYANRTGTSNVTNDNEYRRDTTDYDYASIFESVHMPPAGTRDASRWDGEIAASRHQEDEHRQQIINIQREIEEQATRRRHERQQDTNAPHMPVRLINSSTIRSSVFTINSSSHATGPSNSSINYPHAPPLTPDSDGLKYLRIPERVNAKDDGLPSYDQAVAFDSTTTSVTIRRY